MTKDDTLPPKRRLRAALWAAVSSKPQAEKDSLPDQLADATAYAERMGWDVVAELSVPGHTRKYIFYQDASADMEAYADLQRLANERAFDVLVCRGRDRLGRTDALIAQVEAVAAEGGAQVLSLAFPHPVAGQSDRGTLYMAAIERAGAQGEMVELQRRHKSGMRGRTLRGEHPNTPPYPWLRGAGGTITLPEDRLATARRIFHMFTDHRSYGEIARALNSDRVPAPRGAHWNPVALREMMKQPFLRGIVILGRHTRPVEQQIRQVSKYPAVFSPAEVLLIDEELMRRRKLRRGASSRHPWTGLIICARCGRSMGYSESDRYRYYRCAKHAAARAVGLKACHSNCVSLSKIELAAQTLLERLLPDEAQLDAALAELSGGREDVKERCAELGRVMTRIAAERERLTTAYLRAILGVEEFEKRMAGLAEEAAEKRAELDHLRATLRDMPDPESRREELRALMPEAMRVIIEADDPAVARRVLHSVFRSIACEDGNVAAIKLR